MIKTCYLHEIHYEYCKNTEKILEISTQVYLKKHGSRKAKRDTWEQTVNKQTNKTMKT